MQPIKFFLSCAFGSLGLILLWKSGISAQGKAPWTLDHGPLWPIYQDVGPFQGKQITLKLRLQEFNQLERSLIFYDDKGNMIIIDAAHLFYYNDVLIKFRNLSPGVYYHVRFEIDRLDDKKKLRAKYIAIERAVLDPL